MSDIRLSTGTLTLDQLDRMMVHLPVDVSFVGADGIVRYYSESPSRIFKRTPAVIGRHVTACHPEKSVQVVRRILDAFARGEKDQAQFWITLDGRFVLIRYFAVQSENGEYLGCLEVSQDVTEIRQLEGERRLLDWNA
jgi:PAS domain S-box-containing protein